MNNFINHIKIENFKSLRNCEISGCKRINLFIGRPNAGKSNILEALSVFSLPFLKENASKKISHIIRVENEAELFYNGDFERPIKVQTDKGACNIGYNLKNGLTVEIQTSNGAGRFMIDDKQNFRFGRNEEYLPFVRKYTFSSCARFKKGHSRYLIPPYGYNLLNVIKGHPKLEDEISNLFAEYDLSLVFDKSSQSLKILQPDKNKSTIFLVPYNSIADTLQRIIFFKTTIASNHDAILLFEEPEAHLFPPYISYITQEMILNEENQYFITTHSPFLLNDLLENSREDLAVFMFNYEKHQTVIKLLSQEELHEIYQNGVDLITNGESYI